MRGALVRYGIAPAQIEVEITENICIRNPQYAIEQLNKLCQLGVSVAIDDFGTGYSSLAYLHRFPIHTIKIDQSFVKEIHDEHGHYPVVLAIISIARGLGLHLIAEGVETDVAGALPARQRLPDDAGLSVPPPDAAAAASSTCWASRAQARRGARRNVPRASMA